MSADPNSAAAEQLYRAVVLDRKFKGIMSSAWKTTYGTGMLMVGTVVTYLGIRMGLDMSAPAESAVVAAVLTIVGVVLLGVSHRLMTAMAGTAGTPSTKADRTEVHPLSDADA